jgi:hypothetical protein
MKFKFGRYRDKIRSRTRLLYDRLCIAPDPRSCGLAGTIDELVAGGD